jgi:hypothetical protein
MYVEYQHNRCRLRGYHGPPSRLQLLNSAPQRRYAVFLLNPAHATKAAEKPQEYENKNDKAKNATKSAAAVATMCVIAATTTEQNNNQDDDKNRTHSLSSL